MKNHEKSNKSVDPDPLVLKYQEPRNVTLTITADDDAPFGRYTVIISWADENKGTSIGVTLKIMVVE